MSIRIAFLTVVLKKSAVRRVYPGGLDGFARDYNPGAEDPELLGLAFMASGEAFAFLDVLCAIGFKREEDFALGDRLIGELDRCRGIAFRQDGAESIAGWEAAAQ